MKKIYGIILIVSALVLFMTGCGSSSGIGEKGISKEEFSQIKTGMSNYKVSEIIGGDGEKTSESKEGKVTTYIYTFKGEKGGNAEITFKQDLSGIDPNLYVTGTKNNELK